MKTLPDTLVSSPQTIAGAGKALTLLKECRPYGERGMLVHGKSLEHSGMLGKLLDTAPQDLKLEVYCHPGGEPTLNQVETMLAAARAHKTHWVAAVGGGSVIDAAKACAGLLHSRQSVRACQDGAPIEPSTVPFFAVPTTAGTGSECTGVCVLTNPATDIKRSFRHPSFMARMVILDPDLLKACPAPVIAGAGMDALVQAIESHVSIGSTWYSDQLALKAIELVSGNIEPVYRGDPPADRMALLQGSFLAGLALSNARLGLVHGLAHPLGVLYRQPHGLVCAVCIEPVLEFNRQVIGKKYDAMGSVVGGDLLARVKQLIKALHIRNPFAGQPVKKKDLIVKETLASGSTKSNPRLVTETDVDDLLRKIFAD